MTLKRSLLFFTILMLASAIAPAQSVYTPEKGSKERKDIVDALRVPVKKELKQNIIFVINDLNVSGSWAFLGGVPESPAGGMPDYSNTKYGEDVRDGFFDNNIYALFRKTRGKWKVIKYYIGCTDVCYESWPKDFRAPKAIFPYMD